MSESEWRALGVQQSQGWVHYMIHRPEPQVLLFRRPCTPERRMAQQEQARCERLKYEEDLRRQMEAERRKENLSAKQRQGLVM